MNPTRANVLVSLSIIIVVVVAVLLLRSWAGVRDPLSLSFIGFTNSSKGTVIGLCYITNTSSRIFVYAGDGPLLPHYQLLASMPSANPTVMSITNLHSYYSFWPTLPKIGPKGSVVFPVELPLTPLPLKLRVDYLPDKDYAVGPLTGGSIEVFDYIETRVPFVSEGKAATPTKN